MAVTQPTETTRWRCSLCGNLTRFDVVRTATTRDFVHLDLSGEPTVEESTTVREVIEQVSCRWCGPAGRVELVARPGTHTAASA